MLFFFTMSITSFNMWPKYEKFTDLATIYLCTFSVQFMWLSEFVWGVLKVTIPSHVGICERGRKFNGSAMCRITSFIPPWALLFNSLSLGVKIKISDCDGV